MHFQVLQSRPLHPYRLYSQLSQYLLHYLEYRVLLLHQLLQCCLCIQLSQYLMHFRVLQLPQWLLLIQ